MQLRTRFPNPSPIPRSAYSIDHPSTTDALPLAPTSKSRGSSRFGDQSEIGGKNVRDQSEQRHSPCSRSQQAEERRSARSSPS